MRTVAVNFDEYAVQESIDSYNELVNDRNQIPKIDRQDVAYGLVEYEIFFSEKFPEEGGRKVLTPIPTFAITSKFGDGIPANNVVFKVPRTFDISLINYPENSKKHEEGGGVFDSKVEGSEYAPEKEHFIHGLRGMVYQGVIVFPMPKNPDHFILKYSFFDDDNRRDVFFKAYK